MKYSNNFALAFEGLLILGLLPLLIALSPVHLPLFPILLGGTIYAYLRIKDKVDWKFLFKRPEGFWYLGPILRSLAIIAFTVPYCLYFEADLFLHFPKNYPKIWVLVLFLYPVLSVIPQEIIYRVYFFEVLSKKIKNTKSKIFINAIAFGWVHIIYLNFFALWGTTIVGFLFAWLYLRYKDEPGVLWRLIFEHALYGLIIFTVGLGGFFFLAN